MVISNRAPVILDPSTKFWIEEIDPIVKQERGLK